jgi:hypothetical protein
VTFFTLRLAERAAAERVKQSMNVFVGASRFAQENHIKCSDTSAAVGTHSHLLDTKTRKLVKKYVAFSKGRVRMPEENPREEIPK